MGNCGVLSRRQELSHQLRTSGRRDQHIHQSSWVCFLSRSKYDLQHFTFEAHEQPEETPVFLGNPVGGPRRSFPWALVHSQSPLLQQMFTTPNADSGLLFFPSPLHADGSLRYPAYPPSALPLDSFPEGPHREAIS